MYHHAILALASRMYDQAMEVVADLRSVESGVSDDSNRAVTIGSLAIQVSLQWHI